MTDSAERDWNDVLGVSSIVRFRSRTLEFPPGTMAMVIEQAPAGRTRCKVMIPGRALTYSPLVSDLEVVQGHELDWWKRKTASERVPVLEAEVARLQSTQDALVVVGVTEVAEILGVGKARVGQLRSRDDFPPAAGRINGGAYWHRSDIVAYAEARAEKVARFDPTPKRRATA